MAIPNYRLEPTGKSQFTFWETPAGVPKAVRAWFYPGDNFGQEFAYPKHLSEQIAASAKMTVPTTTATTVEELKTAPLATTNEAGTVAEVETAPPPVRAEVPTPEVAVAAPVPTPAPTVPEELPHTGSTIPLFGLVGLLSLLAAFALRPSRAR